MHYRSIIDISYQTGQSFLDGQPVDLQPLCKELLGWLETFHDVPPIDLSFFKSIIEFGCKKLQCALNGSWFFQGDNLQLLFASTWPSLTHLNLKRCILGKNDLETLGHCLESRTIPKLTSLAFTTKNTSHMSLQSLLERGLQAITSLTLHGIDEEDYEHICSATNETSLPKLRDLNISVLRTGDVISKPRLRLLNCLNLLCLTFNGFLLLPSDLNTVALSAKASNVSKLDISHSSGISGTLSTFLCHSFPSLETLILSDCGLNSDDLTSLAQASVEGLPELKHLDLSDNEVIIGQWRHLFSQSQQWSHLLSLNVKQKWDTQFREDYRHLVNQVRLGALENVQHLTLCCDNNLSAESYLDVAWPNVQSLDIHSPFEPNSTELVDVLQQVVISVEKGILPQLHTLTVTSKFVFTFFEGDPVSLKDVMERTVEQYHVHNVLGGLLPLLIASGCTETSEAFVKYLQRMWHVNVVAGQYSVTTPQMNIQAKSLLMMPYQFMFNFGRQPIEFPVRSWFLECLENS